MNIVLLIIHVLAAVLLIVVVLIQRGRGGGLVESFSGVESMFGTKTNVFLTRATAILATVFLITSISLAVMAARQSRSLIQEEVISPTAEQIPIGSSPMESQLPIEAREQEQLIPEQDSTE